MKQQQVTNAEAKGTGQTAQTVRRSNICLSGKTFANPQLRALRTPSVYAHQNDVCVFWSHLESLPAAIKLTTGVNSRNLHWGAESHCSRNLYVSSTLRATERENDGLVDYILEYMGTKWSAVGCSGSSLTPVTLDNKVTKEDSTLTLVQVRTLTGVGRPARLRKRFEVVTFNCIPEWFVPTRMCIWFILRQDDDGCQPMCISNRVNRQLRWFVNVLTNS